jgi:hypothetical protein
MKPHEGIRVGYVPTKAEQFFVAMDKENIDRVVPCTRAARNLF